MGVSYKLIKNRIEISCTRCGHRHAFRKPLEHERLDDVLIEGRWRPFREGLVGGQLCEICKEVKTS